MAFSIFCDFMPICAIRFLTRICNTVLALITNFIFRTDQAKSIFWNILMFLSTSGFCTLSHVSFLLSLKSRALFTWLCLFLKESVFLTRYIAFVIFQHSIVLARVASLSIFGAVGAASDSDATFFYSDAIARFFHVIAFFGNSARLTIACFAIWPNLIALSANLSLCFRLIEKKLPFPRRAFSNARQLRLIDHELTIVTLIALRSFTEF